jgi:hypothetical protein
MTATNRLKPVFKCTGGKSLGLRLVSTFCAIMISFSAAASQFSSIHQIWYKTGSGARIPLFIIPVFSSNTIKWLRAPVGGDLSDFLYNVRRKNNQKTTFDNFSSATRYLIQRRYTKENWQQSLVKKSLLIDLSRKF